jgi:prevent-host-death family protein
MPTVNMFEAKSNLSRLVEAVEHGIEQEIVIARNGKPVAKLVPLSGSPKSGKRLGLLAGQFPVPTQEEFDADADEIAALFGPRTP